MSKKREITKSMAVKLPIEFSVSAPENATASELIRSLAGALAQVAHTLDEAAKALDAKGKS
jgi:hypothetical protein